MRRNLFPTLASVLLLAAVATQAAFEAPPDDLWWRKAVIYEIYPRSFGDTNGDGIGDLNGITRHLDYLKELGVDAMWITPFYPSPQVDFGYDIADYMAIDPQYGTMADFDRLLAEAQKRNLRVITDLVLNHTSDRHAWFAESRSSRTNPKADWYVWRDGKDGKPPNNWISIFGHSAWEFEPRRGQYYYHAFFKEQPDLNWANREVRNAMYNMMRFWMKRGVAGFRLDAVTSLFEDAQMRDEPVARPGVTAYGDPILTRQYTDNLPEVHDVLREMRAVTNEFPGRVLIGETYLPIVQELAKMYGARNDELHLPMDTLFGFNPLSADVFRARLREAESAIGGNTPLFFFDNHDNPRSWTRYGDGQNDPALARLLATLLLTPRSAALMYYGEEIGMENTDPKRREDVRDPTGLRGWPKEKGRDGERTPMQWDGDTNAGFSTARSTWLPLAPNYTSRNVAAETRDPGSLLNYYKTLLRLRKTNAALRDGDFALVNEADTNVLAFVRRANGEAALVALNFTSAPRTVSFNLAALGFEGKLATTLVSTYSKPGDSSKLDSLVLPPYGAYVGQVR
ncbi:MAG: alpha-glucosidase [Acidobacteriia bacterium]|nr:alpha-glucosidase [Terriglobia bacterium]